MTGRLLAHQDPRLLLGKKPSSKNPASWGVTSRFRKPVPPRALAAGTEIQKRESGLLPCPALPCSALAAAPCPGKAYRNAKTKIQFPRGGIQPLPIPLASACGRNWGGVNPCESKLRRGDSPQSRPTRSTTGEFTPPQFRPRALAGGIGGGCIPPLPVARIARPGRPGRSGPRALAAGTEMEKRESRSPRPAQVRLGTAARERLRWGPKRKNENPGRPGRPRSVWEQRPASACGGDRNAKMRIQVAQAPISCRVQLGSRSLVQQESRSLVQQGSRSLCSTRKPQPC
jgi:hypothetical protein